MQFKIDGKNFCLRAGGGGGARGGGGAEGPGKVELTGPDEPGKHQKYKYLSAQAGGEIGVGLIWSENSFKKYKYK